MRGLAFAGVYGAFSMCVAWEDMHRVLQMKNVADGTWWLCEGVCAAVTVVGQLHRRTAPLT